MADVAGSPGSRMDEAVNAADVRSVLSRKAALLHIQANGSMSLVRAAEKAGLDGTPANKQAIYRMVSRLKTGPKVEKGKAGPSSRSAGRGARSGRGKGKSQVAGTEARVSLPQPEEADGNTAITIVADTGEPHEGEAPHCFRGESSGIRPRQMQIKSPPPSACTQQPVLLLSRHGPLRPSPPTPTGIPASAARDTRVTQLSAFTSLQQRPMESSSPRLGSFDSQRQNQQMALAMDLQGAAQNHQHFSDSNAPLLLSATAGDQRATAMQWRIGELLAAQANLQGELFVVYREFLGANQRVTKLEQELRTQAEQAEQEIQALHKKLSEAKRTSEGTGHRRWTS